MIDYNSFTLVVQLLMLAAGLTFLYCGGDWLCEGASKLALRLGVSSLVVGLTIVSSATSMPELVTSLIAAARGNPDLAIANIVGSNLANAGPILGFAALLYPIRIHNRLIVKEMPILIFTTLLFTIASMGGVISRREGLLLLAGMAAYCVLIVKTARSITIDDLPYAPVAAVDERKNRQISILKCSIRIVAGTILLAFGAELLVGSSVAIAHRIGVSEVIIGLTIVAVGTSLPELSASIIAALRRQSDLCVGNIIGSNLFNILFIGGAVSLVAPLPVIENHLLSIEYPAMVLQTIILWGLVYTDRKISRIEGALLIVLYAMILIFSVIVRHG